MFKAGFDLKNSGSLMGVGSTGQKSIGILVFIK